MFKQVSRFARFTLALGVSTFFTGAALAQFNAVAGRDYAPINPPQPMTTDATVEVLEFFAYGCIHCFQIEPRLEKWAASLPKDTKVVRVPTPFALRGVNSIPLYYTLEAMGVIDKLHLKVFEAIHNDNVVLGNVDVRNQWLSKNGVDVAKFQEMEKSFAVQNKIRRADELTKKFRIESTPTLVLNGKYAVANQREMDMTFRILDTLAANERAALKAAAVAPTPGATQVKATPVAAKPAAPAKAPVAAPTPAASQKTSK